MILDMDMDKEGAIKILGQRKHTSRGSKLMKLEQRYVNAPREIDDIGHGYGQRGSNQNSWTKKAHK
jgi:hypothetical protein